MGAHLPNGFLAPMGGRPPFPETFAGKSTLLSNGIILRGRSAGSLYNKIRECLGRPQIGKNRFCNHLFHSITTKTYSTASALLYFSLLHLSEKSVSQNCFCTLKESSFDANSGKKRRHPVGWRAFLTPICAKMLLLGRIFPN